MVWRSLLRALAPAPGEHRAGEVVLLTSGMPVPLFNPAFVFGPVAEASATVDRIVGHYAALDSPFVASFRDEMSPGLADACERAGLVEHWRPPLMVLDPIPRIPARPDRI